jgi:hypothetical protein
MMKAPGSSVAGSKIPDQGERTNSSEPVWADGSSGVGQFAAGHPP